MPRSLTLWPTSAAAIEAASALADGSASAGDLELGFSAFCAEAAMPERVASPPLRLLLAHAAAREAGLSVAPRGLWAFAETLSELHGSGLGPEELERFSRGGPWAALGRRLAVAQRFQSSRLTATAALDPGALPRAAARALEGEVARRRWGRVVLSPRPSWSQLELELCRSLGASTEVELRLLEDPARPELFAPLEPVHQELHRREPGAGLRLVPTDPADGAAPPLRALLRRLFRPGDTMPEAPVQCFSAATPEAEAREVALRIRALVQSGVPADEIAVAGDGVALEAVASALRRARLPHRGAEERTLRTTPAGARALAL
ncbi:MAG: hypothetical protein ACYCWW_17125, partial [Deltaproteobacteria bacterium]